MKFGRLLRTTSADLPEMQALFDAYKALKKHVKKLPFKEQLGDAGALDVLSQQEAEFVAALSATLQKLNEMFLEREEDSVIRVERLELELAGAGSGEQLARLHRAFIDFHGEVLLLVHWSILAYTATVKILKKHHKRTGLLVRAPELGNLLSQPFCSTELMTSIAHRVEEDILRLAERLGASGAAAHASEPTQQQAGVAGAAAVAAAAAAAAAQLRDGGLDLQLLRQLADSGSSQSDGDDATETAGSSEQRSHKRCQAQAPGQPCVCSQQAALANSRTVSEVQQAGGKRRRLDAGEQGAAQQGEALAAAGQGAGAHEHAQPPQQQPQERRAAPLHVPGQRCSSAGTSDDGMAAQAGPAASGLSAPASSAAAGRLSSGSGAAQGSIMRQTQVALTTWQHLQSSASTPSTVVPHGQLHAPAAPAMTESSAA